MSMDTQPADWADPKYAHLNREFERLEDSTSPGARLRAEECRSCRGAGFLLFAGGGTKTHSLPCLACQAEQ